MFANSAIRPDEDLKKLPISIELNRSRLDIAGIQLRYF